MLCEKCLQNIATVNITQQLNGVLTKLHLCDVCSAEVTITDYVTKHFTAVFTQLQNLINELEQMDECQVCGLTFENLTKGGNLGCADCYQSFSHVMQQILKDTQAGLTHTGEIPWRTHAPLIKERRIEDLKASMQRAVQEEDYEKAAELRDQIRRETQ